jgi:hypothetical protein
MKLFRAQIRPEQDRAQHRGAGRSLPAPPEPASAVGLVIGHHAIAFGDLQATWQPGTDEADQVPVRRVDNLQALRHSEGNRPLAPDVPRDDGIAVVMLAGSLLD